MTNPTSLIRNRCQEFGDYFIQHVLESASGRRGISVESTGEILLGNRVASPEFLEICCSILRKRKFLLEQARLFNLSYGNGASRFCQRHGRNPNQEPTP